MTTTCFSCVVNRGKTKDTKKALIKNFDRPLFDYRHLLSFSGRARFGGKKKRKLDYPSFELSHNFQALKILKTHQFILKHKRRSYTQDESRLEIK